ncbi:EAL domain-containing protein [Dyella sp. 2HG41-7]|uniref:sensor domain-containing phosphodiesterase n=1 Tax=Dyella sp. 2HG41-7 TaxID=2883239 RepID=UPI001F20040F
MSEQQRLADLHALNLLDTPKEEQFEVITQLAAKSLDVPISLISLLDLNRQWFKSCFGLDATETPRDISMCTEAIKEDDIMVVNDATKDPRFARNPHVVGDPYVRFYAGAVIRSPGGKPLGTLCIIDTKPRNLSDSDRRQLLRLARLVESEIRQRNLVGKLLSEIERDLHVGANAPIPGRKEAYEHLAQLIKNQTPVVIALGRVRQFELAASLHIEEKAIQAELAARLRTLPTDVKYGLWRNDQFIVYREGLSPVTTAALLSDIEKAFQSAFELPHYGLYATICLGVSSSPTDASSARHLLQLANDVQPPHTSTEKLLNVSIYSSEGKTPKQYKDDVLARLKDGILHKRFHLVYQPIVDVSSGLVVRAEALLRWTDPVLGQVSPADFIPIAEDSGLIVRIGAFVLETVARDLNRMKENNQRIVPISINISGKQLRDPEFVPFLKALMEKTQLDPGALELEITESSLIEDLQRASVTLNEIRKTGVSCAIDDFGVGFSSFNYLRRLPVGTLKIDRDFILGIDSSPRDKSIVAAIINLAHALGMVVTAEGVEQQTQRDQLGGLGCDLMQGYLIGRPETFDQLMSVVAK